MWVPDYSCPMKLVPLPQFRGFHHFDASLSRGTGDFQCSIEGPNLTLRGAKFDHVVEVCSLSTFESATKHELPTVLRFCLSLPKSINGHSRVEILWRTMLGDTSWDKGLPETKTLRHYHLGDSFKEFVMVCVGSHISKSKDETTARMSIASILDDMQCPSELPSMGNIDQYVEKLRDNIFWINDDPDARAVLDSLERSASLFLSDENLITTGRRLFRAGKGTLGLGPVFCRPNDQIWLIKNSHVPLILRPTSTGTFQLVGECYLHGFMRGQMLDNRWNLREEIGPVTLV